MYSIIIIIVWYCIMFSFCCCDVVFSLVCSGVFVMFGRWQRSESKAESSCESSASVYYVCSDTDPTSWDITHGQHWLIHAERLVINSIIGFSEQCQSQTTHSEGGAQVDAHCNNAWWKYVSGPIQSWGEKLIIFFTLCRLSTFVSAYSSMPVICIIVRAPCRWCS